MKTRNQESEKMKERMCMSKRPPIDLMSLTSEHAAPMPEAVQRVTKATSPASALPKSLTRAAKVRTENLEAFAFKVSTCVSQAVQAASGQCGP